MPFLPSARARSVLALMIAGSLGVVVSQAAPVVASTPAVTAGELGYPYPNALDCNETSGANCKKDQWGFVQGQCHSWVAYRINQLNAAELNGETFNSTYHQPSGQEWGSVWHWAIAASAAGITVDDHPALGSLAWWSADGGHVGYVEAVNADGTVSMSEMNADYHNGFDFATLQRGVRWPTGFIHVADRGTVPDAPTRVRAIGRSHRAKVRWKAPNDGGSPITGYTVTATPGNASVTVGGAATSVMVKQLTNGTSYTFTVRATNAKGNSAASAASNAVVPAAARAAVARS